MITKETAKKVMEEKIEERKALLYTKMVCWIIKHIEPEITAAASNGKGKAVIEEIPAWMNKDMFIEYLTKKGFQTTFDAEENCTINWNF
jgi:hypothetical protein